MIGLAAVLGGCAATPDNTPAAVFDPTNATYIIDGKPVTLVNGKSSRTDAGSGSTTIFGQPVSGDFSGDGTADAAVILVQDAGGNGTFFYVAGAVNTGNVAKGTNAVLLGDRIAPQNVEVKNGQIIANYADRNPGEPMTVSPSMNVSMYLTFDGTTLKQSSPLAGPDEHCGGNMATALSCIAGYHCAPNPASHLPFGDVGGTCIAD